MQIVHEIDGTSERWQCSRQQKMRHGTDTQIIKHHHQRHFRRQLMTYSCTQIRWYHISCDLKRGNVQSTWYVILDQKKATKSGERTERSLHHHFSYLGASSQASHRQIPSTSWHHSAQHSRCCHASPNNYFAIITSIRRLDSEADNSQGMKHEQQKESITQWQYTF